MDFDISTPCYTCFIKVKSFVWALYTHTYRHTHRHTPLIRLQHIKLKHQIKQQQRQLNQPHYKNNYKINRKSRNRSIIDNNKSQLRVNSDNSVNNKNKNTKVLIIYSVIFYIFFSYNKNHLKTQQQKSSCENFVPTGIRTRDLRHRLENQKGDFSQTRSAFSTGSY